MNQLINIPVTKEAPEFQPVNPFLYFVRANLILVSPLIMGIKLWSISATKTVEFGFEYSFKKDVGGNNSGNASNSMACN